MSRAREIIADTISRRPVLPRHLPDLIIAKLQTAGFRILGPDELDAVTVEACAKVVEECGPATQDMTSTMICEALDGTATAIRSLTTGGQDE